MISLFICLSALNIFAEWSCETSHIGKRKVIENFHTSGAILTWETITLIRRYEKKRESSQINETKVATIMSMGVVSTWNFLRE